MKLEFTVRQVDREKVLTIIDTYKALVKTAKKFEKKTSGIRFSVVDENVATISFKLTQPDLVFFDYEILGIINPAATGVDFAEVPCNTIPVTVFEGFKNECVEKYKRDCEPAGLTYTLIHDRKDNAFICVGNVNHLVNVSNRSKEPIDYKVEVIAIAMILFERKIREYADKVGKNE